MTRHSGSPQVFNLALDLSADETVTLPDGRALKKHQLYLEVLRYNPDDDKSFFNLAICLSGNQAVVLHDGRTLCKRQLFLEALRCDPKFAKAYHNLGVNLEAGEKITLLDGRTFNQHQLFLEALRYDPSYAKARTKVLKTASAGQPWTRHCHSLVFGSMGVNVLFATLLLGLQRLETAGVLPPAHHSMLEDMLEGWTWDDTRQCTKT